MAKQKHVHKYILKKMGAKKDYYVYACVLEDCEHYMAAILAQGKRSICWRCGAICKIQITRVGREIKRPHCVKCTKAYPKQVPHRPNQGQPTPPEVRIEDLEGMTIEELLGGDTLFPVSKKEN